MLFTKGNRIGPYTVVDHIGSGGVAEVYRVKRDGAEFALKILLHRWLDDQNSIIRFEREIEILLQLKQEHIIYLLDHAQYEARPYFVMPLLQGGSLREKIKALPQNQFLPQNEILTILRSLSQALDYAHGRNVNHYDVKPENILFNEEGDLFLSDFGLALMEGDRKNTTSRAGTVDYMAPEQWVKPRSELDRRADIYALGVIAYELLTGKRPWQLTEDISRTQIPDIHTIRPDLSPKVQPILVKALAIEPKERYTSAGNLLADIEKALAELPIATASPFQPAIFVSSITGLRSEWPILDNDYELIGPPIDEGGMGVIYKVRQRIDGQIRVIKTLKYTTSQYQAMFRREVEIAQSLQHDHIVPVLQYGYFLDSPAFVMPYLSGGSLAGRIAKKNLAEQTFTLTEMKKVVIPILEALIYAHEQKVKHLDLKPQNILFDDQDNPYLIDFGIASDGNVTEIDWREQRQPGIPSNTDQPRLGTREYMSPEQIMRADRFTLDQRSDIYTIGLILYEILTGQRYYHGTPAEIEAKHFIEAIPDIVRIRPELPPAIQNIINQCLAKHPDRRYKNVSDLLSALQKIETTPKKKIPPILARPAVAALIFMVLLSCLLSLGWMIYIIGRSLSEQSTPTPTLSSDMSGDPATLTVSVAVTSVTRQSSSTSPVTLLTTPSATLTNVPTSTYTKVPSLTPTSSETPTETATPRPGPRIPTPRLSNLTDCNPQTTVIFIGHEDVEFKWYWPDSVDNGYYLELRVGSYTDQGEDFRDFVSLGQIDPSANDGAGNWSYAVSTNKLDNEGYYFWQVAYMRQGSPYPIIISRAGCFRYVFNNAPTSTPVQDDKDS